MAIICVSYRYVYIGYDCNYKASSENLKPGSKNRMEIKQVITMVEPF